MGSSFSGQLNHSKVESEPIRLIDFEDFKALGEYPRFPEKDKIAYDVTTLDLSDAFVIFISHVWLRSRPSLEGFKDFPRPDTVDNMQYKLCVAGVENLLLSNEISLKRCYLWIDYGCLNQGETDLLVEYMNKGKSRPMGVIDQRMGQIMHYCDCVLTPDNDLAEIVATNSFNDMERIANMGHSGYLNRGWCRLEMFHATFIPLSIISQRKRKFFSRAVGHAFDISRRPHFVIGATEIESNKAPLIVPAMKHASLSDYDPTKGYFTFNSDRKVVRTLLNQLIYHYVKPLKLGYFGSTDENGLRHGHGRYVFSSGAEYEGGYLNGQKNGYGRFVMASGDVYEGGYKNDRREGHGLFKFANGDSYEGTWHDGKPNGQGRVEYASGDTYEGHFKDHLKHGFGIFTFSTGCQYEGWYKDDLRHGKGKYVWSDGDMYDGEWKNHMKHGFGEFRFSSGACYQGMWREDNRHGKGKYRLMNGEIYEGEYKNDMREGRGTYQFRSGAKYDGQWAKHLKNGLGSLMYKGDVVYDGEWIDDKPQGYVDPMLIFEDDIQYMEVLEVIRNSTMSKPTVKVAPVVRELSTVEPSGLKVRSQMIDEYYNEDGILDEDDDFHPKNLFRRKSEDWIDRVPTWTQKDEDTILARNKEIENNEEKNEHMGEFKVEKEVLKVNFTPAAAVDEDRHDKVKKMFSPARKVLRVVKMAKQVTPIKVKEAVKPSEQETKEQDLLPVEQDEVSVEDSSPRMDNHLPSD